MIFAISVTLWLIGALVVGRSVALRRMKAGMWGKMVYGRTYGGPTRDSEIPDEDDYFFTALGGLIWPFTLMFFWWTRPPKKTRLERLQAEIYKLEQDLKEDLDS